MRSYGRFLHVFAVIGAVSLGFIDAAISWAVTFIELIAPKFIPQSANASLSLDSIAQDATGVIVSRSQFKAFFARVLSHPLFTAGHFHFDPGRATA